MKVAQDIPMHFFVISCESILTEKQKKIKYSIKPLISPWCPESLYVITRPNQQISLVH